MPVRRSLPIGLALLLCAAPLVAQQVPDLDFVPRVPKPAYPSGAGPVVGIDEGHHNLHTLSGGFAPLAKLLTADGYRTRAVPRLTRAALDSLHILIIVNPLHASNVSNWTLPPPSAFGHDEIALVEQWVRRGGRLWLIADHMPFAGAASDLASAFGFVLHNGFAMGRTQSWPPERFVKSDGTLADLALTRGLDSLAGFTGSAVRAPEGATVLGRFPSTHVLNLPEVAWQFEQRNAVRTLDGLTFGAVLPYGAGRVAVFTEAAMFTAQLVQGTTRVGFTSPVAPHNQAFALRVAHWLDGGVSERSDVR